MNCKPGDMAVVVAGRNLGLIVTIEGVSETYGMPYWRVRTAWLARGINPDGTSQLVRIGSIHDARMRPIKPEPAKRAVETPAEVDC